MPLTAPNFLATLLAHPVAVFGAGVSGQAVLGLLTGLSARGVLYDEAQRDTAHPGFSNETAHIHRLVIFSPGFAPNHPWLVTARALGLVCLGEHDFAALFWSGPTVAITGTNGKTTLTEFLAHALRTTGRTVAAAGNIGHPLSRLVTQSPPADTTAICEISSFQAETLQHFRPGAVLWTNFAEDHLERHPGMDAYFSAKAHLIKRAAGAPVYIGDSVSAYATSHGHALPANVRHVRTEGQPADPQLAGTVFAQYPQRENFLLAAAWWRESGHDPAELYAAAQTFRLGAHRLAKVAERHGVSYWNDSKATNFHAAEAALAGFASPVHWIGGGKSKGGDIPSFVHRIAPRIRHAYLLGETSQTLADAFRPTAVPATLCADLSQAVRAAAAAAQPGDHVILSPGFASLDMFRGYDDRGRQFEQFVQLV